MNIGFFDMWTEDIRGDDPNLFEFTCRDAAEIMEIQRRYPELIPALAAAKDSDLKDANVRTALRKTVAELIELGDDEIDIYEEV